MPPNVYVPQHPARRDYDTGKMVELDLSKAETYGELVVLLSTGREALFDHEASLPAMNEKLKLFRPKDYLLPVGSPVAIAWAAAIIARSYPSFKMLVWDEKYGRYDIVAGNTARL